MIERLSSQRVWANAGLGFEAKESEIRLEGWSRQRRVIVLRRRVHKDALAMEARDDFGQQSLSFAEVDMRQEIYEYSVVVPSLEEEVSAFGQLYRDRADCENIFDELKNQWGWGGFVADPDRHREAIASRPLLLSAIATRTRHARETPSP